MKAYFSSQEDSGNFAEAELGIRSLVPVRVDHSVVLDEYDKKHAVRLDWKGDRLFYVPVPAF